MYISVHTGIELYRKGILKKYNIEVLGTPIESIIATEDREVFANRLKDIGEKLAQSFAVTSV